MTVITEGMILDDGAERIWYDRGTSTKSPRILHCSIHDVHLQIRDILTVSILNMITHTAESTTP
jgi:hypothetical protein